ncbi:TPA: polynucleotide adenylyltransferase PcnB [Legionella anisa]|uniref:Poly(A) polymerase I n=1 Tax=Legionella anisa TaxID=28082 RepID=A0AAX0WTZ6_9GAMM|nr:polynucleotide adenylyltransferase PcnB [Legionella anisa]AWN74245.1 polynucleotide adenylyltransferase PcnB [Legionella anisa]MBN5934314.1 polynucleotide adenylyltransferase PcnB [Legionella anisa]MCW8425723.1 polynucleotide adenylyltransferase PcnB [Legionella anisa]MCW8448847.1 polynucleotide adenylyltransferase PcnB [Legionella anisa]PNL61859.1 polynucleotide adenylyltransferase PcnB [Legionella anisa]
MLKRNRAHVQPVASAYIIPRNKHSISKADISSNALKVLNRLIGAGFQAYIVGGSVRDLLLHKAPKDFDVATDATPNQVKNLFRNGRIIGRRFKLVHILFHREIIEVATFRSHVAIDESQLTNERGMLVRDNAYGSLDEDAWRRDFTINSLYYNISDSSIIDFTGGVNDVEEKLIRMIGDPIKRYQEDPVRMLRAIRFSAKLNFKLARETEAPFPEISHLITHVSNSRLFDEMTKLYQCGNAIAVQGLLMQYGLFQHLFPQTHVLLNSTYPVNALLTIALENTDIRIHEEKPVTPAFLFAVLLWFPMIECAKELQKTGIDPLPSIEKAMSLVLAEQNKIISIPKRYTQIVREIWLLQYRFVKRLGGRAFNLLQHPRFRAAYDFMALRALAGDESMELAQWWTAFQDADEAEQTNMVTQLAPDLPKRKRRRKKPKSIQASDDSQ